MTKLKFPPVLLTMFLASMPGTLLEAQGDVRQVLSGMIYQVSTGQVNPNWYSPQLYQTIAVQTGNSGIYPALRQLGTVQNIRVNQWMALPGGMVYSMTAQHQFGVSFWEFGIGSFTNRIEYASFNIGPTAGPIQLPGQPSSGEPTGPTPDVGKPPTKPQPKPPPNPGQSDACKKFPSLC
jgi:hypothetical protein